VGVALEHRPGHVSQHPALRHARLVQFGDCCMPQVMQAA
jgi:hypothetical protein